MAAQSVTGTGQGMSNGKFKRDNNAGCGNCGHKKCPPPPKTPPTKRGCYVRTNSSNIVRLNAVAGSARIRVC